MKKLAAIAALAVMGIAGATTMVSPASVRLGARVNSVSFSADHSASAILSTAGTTGGGAGPGLAVRVASGARTYYRFATDHAATNNCELTRFLAGNTSLVTFTQAWTDGDRWELRVVGPASAAVLTMYRNGSLVQSFTDNSSLADGSPGMAYSSVAATPTMDSFLAEDISSAADNPPIGLLGRGAGW